MATPVSLRQIVDELEISTDGCQIYLNRQTGETFGATDEELAAAEEDADEELPDWQAEAVAKLREVLASADWLELPTRDGREDYRCMENFCLERCAGRLQDELLAAIRGRGAFGRFKDALSRHGLLESWDRYRRDELAREAAAWLEVNGIAYRE
jgi:hypothetical protein